MGVHGLWKLLDPSGKPVPLETLENKVLAVDVSIWLHQVVKGFQDSHGNPLPNAHLLGLFHRVCKLLFYKIKPVFVFDGGVPHLKKQTVASRRQLKSKAELEADRVREQLLKNLIKHKALRKVLGSKVLNVDLTVSLQRRDTDMFELPPMKKQLENIGSGSDEGASTSEEEPHRDKSWSTTDLHAIDVSSSHFKALPAEVRHDILSELKETRKQSSWGRLHEMPKESGDFSSYQMNRLLKRRSVQVSLEDAEKEMGGRTLSLGELEELLHEQGVVTNCKAEKRIASDSATRYLYVKEVEKQISEKSSKEAVAASALPEQSPQENKPVQDERNTTAYIEGFVASEEEFVSDWTSDSDEDTVVEQKLTQNEANLKAAQNFIFENSGLTQEQILAVIQYQNAVENDVPRRFLSPDQPSTSGLSLVKETNKAGSASCQPYTSHESSMSSLQPSTLAMNSVITTKQKHSSDSSHIIIREKMFGDIRKVLAEAVCGAETDRTDITHKLPKKTDGDVPHVSAEIPSENICDLDEFNGWQEEDQNDVKSVTTMSPHISVPTCDVFQTVSLSAVQNRDNDSDSDESFVEVTGSTALPFDQSEAPQKKTLEVLIERDKTDKIEDDIFADIFTPNTSKENDTSPEYALDVNLPFKIDAVDTKINSMENENMKSNIIRASIEPKDECEQEKCESDDLIKNNLKQNESRNKRENVEVLSDEKGSLRTEEELVTSTMSFEELQKLQTSLEDKHRDLLAEQGKQERLATNVTEQMCMEAQELLQLFGVPYIVAPMEAEAQCAFLDTISLTDGTITDDSDIWLFGGQKVYKNFFNQKKHVMHFKAADIKHYFRLERQHMILLALLVGSDYTPGITGVGPVTALEILAAFPSEGDDILRGLQRFRDWWKSGMSVGPGWTTLKKKLRDLQFVEGFPSVAVVDAYLNPKVDESHETFSWGLPDLASLTDFTRRKFGWTKTRSDEILLPVMKKLEERKTQKSLDSFFRVIPKLQAAEGKLSKRVKQAVCRMGNVSGSEVEDPVPSGTSTRPKRKRTENIVTGELDSIVRRGRGRGRGRSVDSVVVPEQSCSIRTLTTTGEFIPQREKDKINALKSKMKAIEVFRTSRKGLDRTKRQKKVKRQELKEANLSESSSDSD